MRRSLYNNVIPFSARQFVNLPHLSFYKHLIRYFHLSLFLDPRSAKHLLDSRESDLPVGRTLKPLPADPLINTRTT